MKQVFLIVDGLFPTIWPDLREAKLYLAGFEKPSQMNAMYFEYTEKDFKENFCNCIAKELFSKQEKTNFTYIGK